MRKTTMGQQPYGLLLTLINLDTSKFSYKLEQIRLLAFNGQTGEYTDLAMLQWCLNDLIAL